MCSVGVDICVCSLGHDRNNFHAREKGELSDENVIEIHTRKLCPSTVEVPALRLSEEALTWDDPRVKKLRNQFPLKETEATYVRAEGFDKYLQLHANVQAVGTRKDYCGLHFNRLMSIIVPEVGSEKGSLIDVTSWLVAVNRERLLEKAMELDVLSLRFGWTRSILYCVDHLAGFVEYKCKTAHPPWRNVLWHAETFRLNCSGPWIVQANIVKKEGYVRRAVLDGKRLQNMCTRDEVRLYLHQSFCDLAIAVEDGQLNDANIALSGMCLWPAA